jgi:hypothetical protein
MGTAGTLAALGLLALAGCKGPARDHVQPAFLSRGDVAAYLEQAKTSPRADERRRAITRIAQTRYIRDDAVLDDLAPIALGDESSTVRLAAVLAMGKADDPRVADCCLALLQREDAEPAGEVRAAAVRNLAQCAAAGTIPDELRPRVERTAISLLGTDRNRDVRMGAARLLGYFPSRAALDALVEGLDQRDFGVPYEAERSLMRLTGKTFEHDQRAWKKFLAEAADPFAERGRLDQQLAPREKNWMESWRTAPKKPAADDAAPPVED